MRDVNALHRTYPCVARARTRLPYGQFRACDWRSAPRACELRHLMVLLECALRPDPGDDATGGVDERLQPRRVGELARPRETDDARRQSGLERSHLERAREELGRKSRDEGRAEAGRDESLHDVVVVGTQDEVRLDPV